MTGIPAIFPESKVEISKQEYDEYLLLKKKNELEKYASVFWQKLAKELFHLSIPEKIVPIYVKIVSFEQRLKEGITEATMSPRPMPNGKEFVAITVRMHEYSALETLQQNMRHELLHLALYMNGLKHSDYDAIFKVVCDFYDAHFYKKLTGLEQEIYEATSRQIEEAEELCKEYNDSVLWNIMCEIIQVVGNVNITESSLIPHLVKQVEEKVFDLKNYIEYGLKN